MEKIIESTFNCVGSRAAIEKMIADFQCGQIDDAYSSEDIYFRIPNTEIDNLITYCAQHGIHPTQV